MKHNGSYLRQYLPWLGLLLGVDALAALLLWPVSYTHLTLPTTSRV